MRNLLATAATMGLAATLLATGVETSADTDMTALRTVASSSEPGSGRPALGGTNLIRGDRTTVVDVRLTEPATFHRPDPTRRDGLEVIRGAGALVGFALVRDVPGFKGAGFIAGEVTTASGRQQEFSHALGGSLSPGALEWRLPAGKYRLYLITDGKPVTVRLALKGVSGRKRLAPTDSVQSKLAKPALQQVGENLTVAGADGRLARTGMVFSILSTEYDALLIDRMEACSYDAEPPAYAYYPGCLDGSGVTFTYPALQPNPTTFGFTSSGSPLPRGRYGEGFNVQTGGLVASDPHYVAVWMSYR